jgi:hypothetical protein
MRAGKHKSNSARSSTNSSSPSSTSFAPGLLPLRLQESSQEGEQQWLQQLLQQQQQQQQQQRQPSAGDGLSLDEQGPLQLPRSSVLMSSDTSSQQCADAPRSTGNLGCVGCRLNIGFASTMNEVCCTSCTGRLAWIRGWVSCWYLPNARVCSASINHSWSQAAACQLQSASKQCLMLAVVTHTHTHSHLFTHCNTLNTKHTYTQFFDTLQHSDHQTPPLTGSPIFLYGTTQGTNLSYFFKRKKAILL